MFSMVAIAQGLGPGRMLDLDEAALERVPQIGMVTDRGGAGGAA